VACPEASGSGTVFAGGNVGPREGSIEVEPGISLHYSVLGDGPEALIVPNAAWLARPLAPLAKGRRIVCYDLRGRGRSSPVDDPSRLGVSFDVADLEAVRRHLGLEQPAVLGHSYPSAVALLHALEHPGTVARLVLVGGFGARRRPWHEAEQPSLGEMIRPPGAPRLGAMRAGRVHRTDPRGYAREWMRQYLLPLQVARPDHVARVPLDACDLPNEFPERWLKQWLECVYPSMGDWDWRPRLPSLRIPVLLVWGQAERGPREMEREWLEGLEDGHLLAIPDSGHWPFCENPGAFFPAVEAFLAGPVPRPTAHHGRASRPVA
jgi:pimeloyl-ACP methyl ester carboxylesterase